MPDNIVKSEFVTYSYFPACCGAKMLQRFQENFLNNTVAYNKKTVISVDKELKKIFKTGDWGAFFLAILNENQNIHLKDIMKKHDFKVIKKKTNPSGGAMLYLYCKSVGPC